MTHASIAERLEKDIIAAMKARDGDRTTALRMVKTALKNKEIEKRAPLDEAESLQILATLIKQRRDSVEQFTKGQPPRTGRERNRRDRADRKLHAQGRRAKQELRKLVEATLAELAVPAHDLGPKDMGPAMKAVQARIQAAGLRADGRQVSEIVKAELAR